MKQIIFVLALLCSLTTNAQNTLRYKLCSNCPTGENNCNINTIYNYGASSDYTSSGVTSDFGARYRSPNYDWHKGIDYKPFGCPKDDGCRGTAILSLNTGIVKRIYALHGMKMIAIQGDDGNHYGYGHIFNSRFIGIGSTYNHINEGKFLIKHIEEFLPDKVYAILDLNTRKAWGPNLGTLKLNVGNTQLSVNVDVTISKDQDIAPMGGSGNSFYNKNGFENDPLPVHLHLYQFRDITKTRLVEETYETNCMNPLHTVAHQSPNYQVKWQNQNQTTWNNVSINPNGALATKFKVRPVMQNVTNPAGNNVGEAGSSPLYGNVVSNINKVEIQIKKYSDPASAYSFYLGNEKEGHINLGGTPDTRAYPTNIVGTTISGNQLGSWSQQGIEAYAYADNQGHPFDDYYFTDFITRIHKDDQKNNNTKMAFVPSATRYKDGVYKIKASATNINGTKFDSPEHSFTLDNFQPYVENVSVHCEGGVNVSISNMNWLPENAGANSSIRLIRPSERGFKKINELDGHAVVYAIFSESMNSSTVKCQIKGISGDVTGVLIDDTQNKYKFTFSNVNFANNLALDKCYELRFLGKDMSDNPLIDFKLPPFDPTKCGWTNNNALRVVPKRLSQSSWDAQVANGKDEVFAFRMKTCNGFRGGEDPLENRSLFTSCDDFLNNLTINIVPITPLEKGKITATLTQGSTEGYTIKWTDTNGNLVSSDWSFEPSIGGSYCYIIESDCAKTGEYCAFNNCVTTICSGFEQLDPEFSEAIKFQLQEPSEKGKLVVVTTVSYKDFDPSQAIIQWFDNYGNLVTTADGFSPQLGPGRYCARIQWGCITGENCIDVGCDLRENLTIVEHTAKIEQNFNDNGLSSVSITFTNPEDNYGGDQIIWYNSSGEEIGQGLIIEGLTPGKYKYKISRGNCYGGEFEIEITGCESMARISDADYTIQQAGTDIWGYFLYLTFLDEEKYKNLTVKWFDGSGLIGEGNKIKVQLNSAVFPVFIYKDCFKPMPITVIDRCEQLKGAYAQTPIIFYQPMSGLSPNYTVGFRYTLHSISENFLIELFDENGQLLRSATIPAMWDVPPGRYTVKFYDNGCMFFSANIELLPCPDDPNWYNWMINDYHGILVNHYQNFNNQGSIKLKNIGAPAWSAGIEWYNGQGEKISTGNQITGLSPGVYCLKVKDDGPCLNLDRCFKIFNCGNFDAKITPTGSFSSTCKDGKLKIEVIYSSGLYSIDIKGPDGMITSLENEPKDPITGLYLNNVHIFDGLLPGIYDIEIKDIHCGSTYKYKEVVGTLPIGISRVTNIRTCRDNDQIGEGSISLNLGTEDTKDWEISWSGSGPFTYTNNGISNINTPGTYKVLIVNKQSCSLQFEQKIVCCLSFVTINGERTIVEPNIPPLNINLIPTHIDGIKDNFGRIFTEGAGPNLAFNWAGPDGYSSSNPSLTNLKAGVYCLTVTNGCDSYNTCIQVYDCRIDKININLIGLDACSERLGNEIKIYPFGILRTSPSGGVGAPYNIEWSNGSTQDYIDNLSPGDYCVTVSDRIGCRVDACFAVGSNQALFTDPNCNITCNARFIREQSVVKSWWNPDHCNLLHYLCQGSDITHTYEYPDITISPPTNSMSCDITILCPNPARTLKYIIPGYEETICLSDKSNQNQSDFFNYYGCLVSYCDYPTLGKFMYKKILEEYDEINCTNVEEEGEPPSYYCLVSLYCDNGKISESPTALGSFEGAFEPTEIECAGNLKFNVLYEGRPPTKLGDNPDIFSLTISDNCDYLKCSLNNKVKSGNGKIAVFNSKNILLATYLVYLKEGFKEVLLPLDDLIGKDEVIKCELTLPNGRMISKTIENTCHLLRSKPIENVKRWNVSVYPNPSFSSLFCKLKIDIPAIIDLEVFDNLGIKTQNTTITLENGTHILPLEINNLTPGIYYLKIINKSTNAIEILKFVKM